MSRIEMQVTCKTASVLATLKKNRKVHSKIVLEAREGYMKAAEKALQKRLNQLRKGALKDLQFGLYPPQDFTHVYDTAIQMLEMHTEPTLTLSAQDVETLVMDKWEWMDSFLMNSSVYSGTAVSVYQSKSTQTD